MLREAAGARRPADGRVATWDGRSDGGMAGVAGVHCARLDAGGERRMELIARGRNRGAFAFR